MDFLAAYGDGEKDVGDYDESQVLVEKKCEICQKNQRLYKCPRCSIFSCSLECCRRHKVERSCSGIRDKSEFVPVNQFCDRQLRNDYHFLEDVLQSKLRGKRLLKSSDPLSIQESIGQRKRARGGSVISPGEPAFITKLKTAANIRGVTLVTMPQGMSKRMMNSTRYLEKGDIIFWRIHFVFILKTPFQISALQRPEDDTKNPEKPFTVQDSLLRITVNEAAENVTLNSIIDSFSSSSPDNATLRHMLSSLRKSKNIRICMQKLPCMAGAPVYIELDGSIPIKECLSARTIIEYPTIVVGTVENTSSLTFFISNADDVGGVDKEIVDDSRHPLPGSTISPSFAAITITKYPDDVHTDFLNEGTFSGDEDEESEVVVGASDQDMNLDFIAALKEFTGKDIEAIREFLHTDGEDGV